MLYKMYTCFSSLKRRHIMFSHPSSDPTWNPWDFPFLFLINVYALLSSTIRTCFAKHALRLKNPPSLCKDPPILYKLRQCVPCINNVHLNDYESMVACHGMVVWYTEVSSLLTRNLNFVWKIKYLIQNSLKFFCPHLKTHGYMFSAILHSKIPYFYKMSSISSNGCTK